jgi:undecaprenyl-diphosphatase
LLWWKGESNWKALGRQIINATLLGALVSYTLKGSFQRPRPQASTELLYLPFDKHSFPSGHATRIGTLTAVIGKSQLPGWTKMLFGIWSLLVCFSRVALGAHFMGDIIAGFVSGLGVGSLFLSQNNKPKVHK